MTDANPLVNGAGIEMLRAAGVRVESGVLEAEAKKLNEAFVTYIVHRRPFGILKIAMTLDGKIATKSGESKWITSDESRERVQQLRHQVDALVTGSGTVLADRPRLTDRSGLPRRRPLLPVILDRRSRVTDFPGVLLFRGNLEELTKQLWNIQLQSFQMYLHHCHSNMVRQTRPRGTIASPLLLLCRCKTVLRYARCQSLRQHKAPDWA
jgi:hypothetical protein